MWDLVKCPFYKGVLISGVSFKRGSIIIYNFMKTHDTFSIPDGLIVAFCLYNHLPDIVCSMRPSNC